MMTDYPPVAFQFAVSIAGGAARDASFLEVGGIGADLESEDYREGGENRFVHALPRGVRHPRLALRRGVADTGSPLVQWCRDVLEGGLVRPIVTRALAVTLIDERAAAIRGWTFADAYPVAWSIDPFRADRNEAAIEKIEFAYTVATRTA